jgi:hypothetical protein
VRRRRVHRRTPRRAAWTRRVASASRPTTGVRGARPAQAACTPGLKCGKTSEKPATRPHARSYRIALTIMRRPSCLCAIARDPHPICSGLMPSKASADCGKTPEPHRAGDLRRGWQIRFGGPDLAWMRKGVPPQRSSRSPCKTGCRPHDPGADLQEAWACRQSLPSRTCLKTTDCPDGTACVTGSWPAALRGRLRGGRVLRALPQRRGLREEGHVDMQGRQRSPPASAGASTPPVPHGSHGGRGSVRSPRAIVITGAGPRRGRR